MVVTCVGDGLYNFEGSFVGTDNKTYTWSMTNVEVGAYAYDEDTGYYEEVTLTDDPSTAVEAVKAEQVKAVKELKGGNLYIKKNKASYSVLGQRVK